MLPATTGPGRASSACPSRVRRQLTLDKIMSIEVFFTVLAASFLLWITTGQDAIYIIARSISQGKPAGIVSALGVSTGGLVHACLAIAGVSLAILTSPILFLFVQIIGVLYLVYLGISSLLSKPESSRSLEIEKENLTKVYT